MVFTTIKKTKKYNNNKKEKKKKNEKIDTQIGRLLNQWGNENWAN